MNNLSQLETCANELAAAIQSLADQSRDAGIILPSSSPLPNEMNNTRRSVLASLNRLEVLLASPADLVQKLASQSQLLACLRWLGEFQILACIPLDDSVPTKDVADLTGVPETQLSRIVRMTATAGFLHEPRPGYIAHTALSAPFVTQLSYLYAAMFLAETAAPAALQMAAATKRHDDTESPSETAYSLAFNTSQTFQSACEQQTKLQRHWPAFLRCLGDVDDSVAEVLSRLDWLSLGNACIVDILAHSTASATALAELFPALQFIVQLDRSSSTCPVETETGGKARDVGSRVTVQRRTPGSPQTVKDAAVYMLRIPARSLGAGATRSYSAEILAELRAHLGVLRANTAATFALALRPLPDRGSVDPDVQAMAHVRDLCKMQLANCRDMEVQELVELVRSVRDSRGRLEVINKLHSRTSATVALGIKYQAYGDGPPRPHESESGLM